MAGIFNVQSSSETDGKYEKIGKVDGRMTSGVLRPAPPSTGEYGVLVGERFMVAAEGDGVSIDDLKAAASASGSGASRRRLAKAG